MDPHQASTPHLLGLHTFQRWEAHYLTKALPHLQGTDEPQNCLPAIETDPLCLLKGRASAPRPVTLAPQRVHTHTHSHTDLDL